MARGWPDFTRPVVGIKPEVIAVSQAAQPYIWFRDDFESSTLKWGYSGGSISRDTTAGSSGVGSPVYSGDACLKITADGALSFATAFRSVALPTMEKKIGISNFIYWETDSDFEDSENAIMPIAVKFYTGSKMYDARVSYNPNNGKWYVSTSVGSMDQLVATKKLKNNAHHFVKLVLDMDNKKYYSLQVDGEIFDISSYSIANQTDTSAVHLYVFVYITKAEDKTPSIYVDEFTITGYG